MASLSLLILYVAIATLMTTLTKSQNEYYVVSDGTIRLVSSSKTCNSGMVQFYVNKEWGSFDDCTYHSSSLLWSKTWKAEETNVFCKQLGFINGGLKTYYGYNEYGTDLSETATNTAYENVWVCNNDDQNICKDCILDGREKYSRGCHDGYIGIDDTNVDYGNFTYEEYKAYQYNIYIDCEDNKLEINFKCDGPYNTVDELDEAVHNSYQLKDCEDKYDVKPFAELILVIVISSVACCIIICVCCFCCGKRQANKTVVQTTVQPTTTGVV